MFYDTDSTEAMKSHMSDLVLGKQEQIAYINQLERGLEENKIERNSNSNEINQVENELVPDETFEKKKEYTQQVLELHEKENLYEKLKETFEEEQTQKKKTKVFENRIYCFDYSISSTFYFFFFTANLIFGIIFALLTVIFVVGIIFLDLKQ